MNRQRGASHERLARQFLDRGIAWDGLAAASAAPVVRFGSPAREIPSVGLEQLIGSVLPGAVQTGGGGQFAALEAIVRHIEVLLMGLGVNSHHRKTPALILAPTRGWFPTPSSA